MVNVIYSINVLHDFLHPIKVKNLNLKFKINNSLTNYFQKKWHLIYYLAMKNKLPMLNNNTNFLAFKTSSGIYKLATDIQKTPIAKQNINPRMRCFFDY